MFVLRRVFVGQQNKNLSNVLRRFLATEDNTELIHSQLHDRISDDQVLDSPIPCSMIPGDGVGPELCGSVLKIFKAIHAPVQFQIFRLSELDLITSDSLETVIEGVKRNKYCLRGVMATPRITPRGNVSNVNLQFRRSLKLYANVSHVKSIPGVPTRHNGINLFLIREQTEGEYSSLEHSSIPGVVEHLKITTRELTARIAHFACKYATMRKRKKITVVHKANVMKKTDGLFLHTCRDVGKSYPHLEIDDIIIDHCCMKMLTQPQAFDVILCPSLYGTILINIATGLIGGCGLLTSTCFSTFDLRIFGPAARHAFLSATGQNIANPAAMILASAKLLNEMGLFNHGELVKQSVLDVLLEGKIRTRDIGGHNTTDEFTQAVISVIYRPK